MGRPTLLFALLLMVLIADMTANNGAVVHLILDALFGAGQAVRGVFDTIARFFTTGR